GDDLDAAARSLARLARSAGARRIVTIGSSMGAYAALAFGLLIGADRVLAFGPETRLLLPGSRSASFVGRRPALRHADLLPLAERNRRTDIVLYTGESDVIDVYSAHRLRRAPRVRLLSVRGYGHEVARFFHEQGLLPP